MNHDKIEAVLKRIAKLQGDGLCMSRSAELALEQAADLIRDLRTEIDNQETKIVDLGDALEDVTGLLVGTCKDATVAREPDQEIAVMNALAMLTSIGRDPDDGGLSQRAADNAALIAVVPQMVEALELARSAINERGLAPDLPITCRRIDAALASIGRGK